MKLISDRLKNGEKPIGTLLNLGSQTAAECVAIAGMDYFIVDLEHSPFGLAEAADCIRMAKLKGISPLVRIPEISRANILKHLDVGAEGIIIPGLKTREEAEKIVEYGKYTPLGSRGFCPTRVCEFGYGDAFANGILEYTRKTNEETMLIPQCETLECLADIENIVSVEGIGGIFIGPFDLSLAMGIPAQFDRPEFKEAKEYPGIKEYKTETENQGFQSVIHFRSPDLFFQQGALMLFPDTPLRSASWQQLQSGIAAWFRWKYGPAQSHRGCGYQSSSVQPQIHGAG